MATERATSEDTPVTHLPPSRRSMLRGAAAVGMVGLAGATLAACGGGGDDTAGSGNGGTTTSSSPSASPGGDGSPTASPSGDASPSASPAGEVIVATADVPVGGGTIVDEKYVVTQPTAGDFKAFSAICTHMNCVVANVRNGSINCGCHGSRYSIEDGSVERGPSTRALPDVAVAVQGSNVVKT